ncbi:tyrosinase-like [Pseudophryne corroboree]|uniref:tyrosinase-like n=1 Tax=Pseudophryne corroboree TaxID=495146 RepID=UPI00308162F1
MLLLCAFTALCLGVVHSQFPRECTTQEALNNKYCCPYWKDGSRCGSNSRRGQCRGWVVLKPIFLLDKHHGYVRQYDDDRLDWPNQYYDHTCECFGNYSGYNCGSCRYGFFGEKCERQKTNVRKEIRQLSLVERKRFFSYLALAKTTRSKDFVVLSTGNRHNRDTYRFVDASVYEVFAWIHYYSMKAIMKNGTFDNSKTYAYQGPAFPGWHRLGLLFIERQIQLLTGDEGFALPYYDWRGDTNCSICTEDYVGESDAQGIIYESSYLAEWKVICSDYNYIDAYCPAAGDYCQRGRLRRKPGADPTVTRLPSFQDVEDTLKWKDFDTPPYNDRSQRSFRNCLEGFLRPSDGTTFERGMHNLVHVYMGGTMAEIPISANDPVFMLHHAFVDKVFQVWMQRHNATMAMYPENNQPGQGPAACVTPYLPCYKNREFLSPDSAAGYTYSEYQGL